MEILSGLMDHQVLQRSRKNVSETILIGRCVRAGELQVQVVKKNRPLSGLNWRKIAAVPVGNFTAALTGLPVGGPYDVSLRVVEPDGKAQGPVRFRDLLVGDVWILAGQSNMEGYGLLKKALKPVPRVRAFYMNDRWGSAKDPIHNLGLAVDPVHTNLNGGVPHDRSKLVGTGPGVAFGQKLLRLSNGVPQGLICCAHGGTCMTQWDSGLRDQGGKSLYGATLRRFHKNGGKVAGVVWYQGCSDALSEQEGEYTDRMEDFVAALRRDLADPDLPFVMVQIAGYFPGGAVTSTMNRPWISVQEQQRRLSETIRRVAVVPAIDLDYEDAIHLSALAQHRVGARLAQAAWTLIKGKNAQKPPIALKAVRTLKPVQTAKDPEGGWLSLEVVFDHVEGGLQAPDRPAGFALVDPDGQVIHAIYRVDLKGNRAILRTGLAGTDYDHSRLSLCYGYGLHAYGNIRDQADRSLPVFAATDVILDPQPRLSIRTVRISKRFAGAGKLDTLTCPDTADAALEWQTRTFPTTFYDIHLELGKSSDDAAVFFANKFHCPEPMKLNVGLGYDGPVKMWLDTRSIFHDPDGVNPAYLDKAGVDVDAAAGEHELVVALSTNFGKAWGIMLRLYRTDLTRPQVRAGRNEYAMPQLRD